MATSKEARKKAARKRATVRAQERTRRTTRTPGKVSEQGVGWGNVARGVARIVGSASRSGGARPAANAGSRAAKIATRTTSAKSRKEAVSKMSASDRKRYEEAVATARSFGGRTTIKSGRSKIVVAKGNAGRASRPKKPTAKQMAQAKSARDSWRSTQTSSKSTGKKLTKKKKVAIGAGVGAGVGSVAYATYPRGSRGAEGPKKNKITTKGNVIRFRK